MELLERLRQELNLTVTTTNGRPVLDLTNLSGPRWPRKVRRELCVAIDPYGPVTHRWPLPRFEILIANLDAIGLQAVAVGRPGGADDERLQRAVADFSGGGDAMPQACAISQCLLWVGHDTLWRHVAAAVGVPQVVIALDGKRTEPAYKDTVFVLPGSSPAESKALGPVGVAEVAEAVSLQLKKRR